MQIDRVELTYGMSIQANSKKRLQDPPRQSTAPHSVLMDRRWQAEVKTEQSAYGMSIQVKAK